MCVCVKRVLLQKLKKKRLGKNREKMKGMPDRNWISTAPKGDYE
jgi:hypothetical protein